MRFRKAIVILSIALSTVSQRSGGIALEAQSPPDGWRQFGGPDRSFILSNAPRLADVWPETGPHADGKAILIDEDGDLALLKLAPEGVTVLSEFRLFDTVSWTVPTLVGTTLYARDREKIVALDLGVR